MCDCSDLCLCTIANLIMRYKGSRVEALYLVLKIKFMCDCSDLCLCTIANLIMRYKGTLVVVLVG